VFVFFKHVPTLQLLFSPMPVLETMADGAEDDCPRRLLGTEELGWNERSREEITRREITIKWI
jgi:hypothetical protein